MTTKKGKGNGEIQGSLRYATNDEAVRRFGRDDVLLLDCAGVAWRGG
jgi:hypothetical protein